MKKIKDLSVLFLLFILYWIIVFIIAITIDSQHLGGEQYFLTIITEGIGQFPFFMTAILLIITLLYADWVKRNKYLLIILSVFLVFAHIYCSYFNHQ